MKKKIGQRQKREYREAVSRALRMDEDRVKEKLNSDEESTERK